MLKRALPMIVLCGCATVRVVPPAAPTLEAVEQAIDENAQATFQRSHWSNLALGIVSQGRLIWAKGYGLRTEGAADPVTAATVFRFGSITKTFTSLALLQLRDEGKVALDDPAERYLPELRGVVYPTTEHPPITLRELLTHTSGLPAVGSIDYTQGPPLTEAQLLGSLQGLKLEATPGTHAQYSNLAMCLVGLAVSRIAHLPYREVIEARIAQPLGLHLAWTPEAVGSERLASGHTAGHLPVADWTLGACEPCGGIYGSLDDLARYAAFELSAWPPRDAPESPLASRSTLREAQSVLGPLLKPFAFGANWVVQEDPALGHVVWHNGETLAYAAELWMLPARGLAVVALLGEGSERGLADLVRATLKALLPVSVEPAVKLGGSVQAALDRLLPLLEPTAGRAPDELFTPGFVSAIRPTTPDKILADLRELGGSCRVWEVRSSTETLAKVRVGCAKGAIDLTLAAQGTAPNRITGLSAKPAK